MPWAVSFADEFEPEFDELDNEVRGTQSSHGCCFSNARGLRSDDRMPTP